jgi:hypothetical protein
MERIKYSLYIRHINSRGVRHRNHDLPAQEYGQKIKYYNWYDNGVYHRNNNLPSHIGVLGGKMYCKYGKCFQENKNYTCIDFRGNRVE